MNNSAFFIVGKHAVIEALKNPNRKVLRVFLTEDSKKILNKDDKKLNDNDKIYLHFSYGIISDKLKFIRIKLSFSDESRQCRE